MGTTNTIYGFFVDQVSKRPDALAVKDSIREVTFKELEGLVNTIAAHFPCRGSKAIGIVMDHGIEMIASILAVLKTGATYVPAEPSFPIERIRYMMKESDVDFVITHTKFAEKLDSLVLIIEQGIEAVPVRLEDQSVPEGRAYVLYTSGTTGVPKGVQVTNSNVCHYVRAFQNEFNPGPGDRMLQYSVCSFDIFVEEVFTTILSGASLFIPDEEVKKDINSLMEYVEDNQITEISGFPYLLNEMNKLPSVPKCLRLIISGGDVIRAKYIDHLKDCGALIYNTYGPSETTVCASYYRVDNALPLADGTFPIGKAVLGTTIEIMDEESNPVPDGEVGEICIFGGGVSLGYCGNKPENKNFTSSADGRRFYRSGDLGYVLPDGNLAFLHRKDAQVMILGKRVECEEVENLLCTFNELENAVVCPYLDTDGLAYLVAYIVPKPDLFDLRELKRKLALYLTPFMIPEYFVSLSSIPLTPNGKVDRQMLPVVLKEGTIYK